MTRAHLQALLKKTGLRPQTAAGQNFLLDEQIPEAMVEAADVQSDETILEIGPGFGVLTAALLERGAKVVAIELDKRLAAYLRKTFKDEKNLTLVEGDVFRVNWNDYVADCGFKIVANLPYSVTSLLIRNALTVAPRPTSLTIMIQDEVARRITAAPGDMSLLSLMAQYYGQPEYLWRVPPESFWPVPKVQSAVIHIEAGKDRPETEEKSLISLAKAGFSSRRKQLHNSLLSMPGTDAKKLDAAFKKTGISPSGRAQDLSVEDWLTLAANLR